MRNNVRGTLDLDPGGGGLVDEELLHGCERGDDILLQAELVVQLHGGVVADHKRRQGSAFALAPAPSQDSRRLAELLVHGVADLVEDGFVEEVDSAVDRVGYERLGLLDVVARLEGLGVDDDLAELGGRLGGDLFSVGRSDERLGREPADG